MVVGAFRGRIDQASLDLRPAEHLLRIEPEQGDARVALHVQEPVSPGAAIDPQLTVAVLVPDWSHLHTDILASRAQDDGQGFVEKCLQAGTELESHARLYTLNPS